MTQAVDAPRHLHEEVAGAMTLEWLRDRKVVLLYSRVVRAPQTSSTLRQEPSPRIGPPTVGSGGVSCRHGGWLRRWSTHDAHAKKSTRSASSNHNTMTTTSFRG